MRSTAPPEGITAVVGDALASVTKAAGASKTVEYEAFAAASVTKRVTVQPDGGRGLSLMNERTLFVRVMKEGRMGISYTNDFRPRRILECYRNAARLSSHHQEDESLAGFPSAAHEYPHIEGLYDREIARLELAEASDMVDEMLDSVLDSDKEIQVTGGQLGASDTVLGIRNSGGIDAEQRSTCMDVSCAAVCGKGRSVSPECISTASSRRNSLDMADVGERCSFIASQSCIQTPAKTGECEVVFSPRALGSMETGLLTIMMSRALSGMDVLNGSTVLADRLGDQVASGSLSIRDAPTLPGRSGSRSFDDEGMPTGNKWLVKKGILESFVWDSRYGSQQSCGSTGNATRDMRTGLVTPAPLLLEVNRGRGNMHDLISEVDNGYLIWDCQGAHTSSPETGAFSFVASPGLKIEGGNIVGGVQGAMLSGNIIDLMRSIDRIGSDHEDFGCSLMPSILFRDVRITTG